MNILRKTIPIVVQQCPLKLSITNFYAAAISTSSFQRILEPNFIVSQKTQTQIWYSTTTLPTKAEEEPTGIIKKMMRKVGWVENSRARLRVSSYMLYESVADQINYYEIFNKFNLPNTFNSWFLVTELHVWMLLVRSMAEGSEAGEDGRFLRNCIVEAMWADVNTRAKKLGANNPSGTRHQIQVLSQQFQAALITYDEGIMSDDKILAGALWRRFLERKCNDFVLIEELVKYVRRQVLLLDSLTREDFIKKPKISWIKFKDV